MMKRRIRSCPKQLSFSSDEENIKKVVSKNNDSKTEAGTRRTRRWSSQKNISSEEQESEDQL